MADGSIHPALELPDPDLAARFRAGDSEAFSILVQPHLDALFAFCLRLVGTEVDAEEAVQDTVFRALRACASYQPDRPFRPWIMAIAANLCRDHHRSAWNRRSRPLDAERTIQPGEEVTDAHRNRRVRKALRGLPDPYKEALALFYLGDMSYEEMATITGDSVAALKQRVRRGRVMLRAVLEARYPDDPDTWRR